MKKFKFLKISHAKKLRYIDNYSKEKVYLIFLPGFMSDIEGKKPQTLFKFAKKNKLGFLTLEYSGHGKSSGKFIKGNISSWSNDSKVLIKKFVKKNDFILIGSSMGAWISLKMFKTFNYLIKITLINNGKGIPENDVKAYSWWSVAKAQGHKKARSIRCIPENRMTKEQIAGGQALAAKCWESEFQDCD